MTAQQKFWLKVALAVTFPLWILPTIIGAFIALSGALIWQAVSALVEPRRRHDDPTDDGP